MNDIETTPVPVATEAPRTPDSPQDNTVLMSVLAYISFLVFIPYFTAKENPAVQFHVRQGIVLLIPEIALWVAGQILFNLFFPLVSLLNLGLIVLSIIGIVNAVQKKQVELPLVGKYAKHITI